MKKFFFSLCILLCNINQSYAQNSIELMLEKTLKCDHDFEPANILKMLKIKRIIGKKPVYDGDGIHTYLILKPTKVFNKDIKIVEAWSFNKMFDRGPGTAPPTHIAIGFGEPTSQNENTTKKYESEFPDCSNRIKGNGNHGGSRSISTSNYFKDSDKQFKHYPVYMCVLHPNFTSPSWSECNVKNQ